MKTQYRPARRFRAFTLVELLVVMAVIAVLAAMIFPAAGHIKKRAAINKARTELKLAAMAIESYKGSLNHYPPDNPGNPAVNQLYYELIGTTNVSGTIYLTDSGRSINASAFFGPTVTGFVNVSRGSDDEGQKAKNSIPGLKPSQYLEVTNGAGASGIVLGIAAKGPFMWDPLESTCRHASLSIL